MDYFQTTISGHCAASTTWTGETAGAWRLTNHHYHQTILVTLMTYQDITISKIVSYHEKDVISIYFPALVTMVMQVLAGGHRVAASVVFQAAIYRGHHLLQTLDSITHVSRQTLTITLVLEEPDYWVISLKQELRIRVEMLLLNDRVCPPSSNYLLNHYCNILNVQYVRYYVILFRLICSRTTKSSGK